MLKFGNEKHIGVGSGGDAEWGYIEGTLSDQTDLNTALNGKQATLVSGTNIKTINGVSVLGEGDIEVGEGGTITVNQSYDATSTYAQSGTAVAEAISTKANTSLNNLSSDGQLIIDSQNGTISNCVLEIPQNIKLTLENNVLTLKAGSIITLTGSTYATVTTTQDNTLTISTDDTFVVFSRKNGLSIGNYVKLNKIGSGSSLPADGTIYNCFFNTTDKLIYLWYNNEWIVWNVGYPLCVVKVENGNMSFAKDSNGRDMVFNGAGFIGQHRFVYPGVKCLFAAGKDSNGKLLSNIVTTNGLLISNNTTQERSVFYLFSSLSANAVNPNNYYFSENENLWRRTSNNEVLNACVLSTTIGNVDSMTIRQPVRTATTEMLDKKQDTLTFDTTPTSASTNPVTSGGVYTALSGKQADITTITGYDATKTQTLKNVSGVLTWVDDGE